MAQNAQVNIKVDSNQASQSVNDLNKSLNSTTKSTSSLRAELRQVTQELQNLQPGSERFTELSLKAGQLRDTIKDTNAVINATAGSGVENLGKSLSNTAQIGISGFQGLVSAQALFGSESKELQETLVKLQALAGLSDALSSLGGLKDSITEIKSGFISFGKSAMTALQGVKGAVAATGIGLLVVMIGTMVAYWDDIKTAIGGVSSEQEQLNKRSQKNVELNEGKLKTLKNQDNILKLQGLSEKQILERKVKQTGEVIRSLQIQIKNQEVTLKSQVEAERRNKEILKGIIGFVLKPLDLILKTVDGIGKFLGKDWNLSEQFKDWTASLIFDPEQTEEEGMKTINEMKSKLNDLKNEQAGYLLDIKKMDEDNAKERNKIEKGTTDDLLKETQEKLKLQRQLEDSRVDLMQEGLDKELKQNELKYSRMIEDMKLGKKNLNKQELEIIENYEKEKGQKEQEIRDKFLTEEEKKKEEERKKEIEQIKKMMELDEKAYQEQSKARDLNISLMKDGFDKEKALRQAAYQDRLHELQTLLDNETITRDEYNKLTSDAYKKLNIDLTNLDEKQKEESIKIQKEKYEKISEQISLWGNSIMGLANNINDLFNQIGENREKKITETNDLELSNLKEQYDKRIISQEEFDAKSLQIESDKQNQLKILKQEQFRREKALNIANAIMAGAQAVLQALSSSVPPINFILAGIAGAAAGVQIATISAQQFTAANGGIVPGSGPGNIDSVPSLLAPGEAVINSRSTAMFPRTLDLINRAGGGQALLPEVMAQETVNKTSIFESNKQQPPIKAYVVETEITDAQKRINRIERSVEF